MSDSTATSNDAAAQRAAEQARLRRERREAKIKAGGSSRLDKINGMGGRIVGETGSTPAPSIPSPAPASSPAAPPSATTHDPEEVDISEHYYAPRTTPPAGPFPPSATPPASLSEAQLRQMMLGLDRPNPQQQQPGGGPPGAPDDDPLMKMMSQLMGPGGIPGLGGPDGLGGASSPFAGMSLPQQQAPVQQAPRSSLTLWRILHALVALGLGFFFILTTQFTGTKPERERMALAFGEDGPDEETERRKNLFFWTFATAEVLLLSSRFFLDKRSTNPTGFVATAISYVPQPYRGYIEIVQRYVQIFLAVRTDILTCIFVLGVCAWWSG